MKRSLLVAIVTVALLGVTAGMALAQGAQNVELHGYMLNRVYANPKTSAQFAVERLSLSTTAKVGQDGTAYAELYFHPYVPATAPTAASYATTNSLYLESCYVDLPMGEAGRIRLGKGRQQNFGMVPAANMRKTTQYGIVSEAFTQDRIIGAQYMVKKDLFDGGISLFTDQRIETRKIGYYPGLTDANKYVSHFVDKDEDVSLSGRLAFSIKAGVANSTFQAHASAAFGKLQQADIDFVSGKYGFAPGAITDTKHNKFGFDLMWTGGPWCAQGEWYQGQFSFLKVTGWNVLAGYQPQGKRRAYVRYAELKNNQPANANDYTWNTRQLTLALVQPIRKGVWAEFQYERNMESFGKKDNDMLFVEFFTGF